MNMSGEGDGSSHNLSECGCAPRKKDTKTVILTIQTTQVGHSEIHHVLEKKCPLCICQSNNDEF